MQKFVQYACILPCCISSQMSVANVDEPLTSPPIVQQEQTPKKIGKIIVVNNPIFDESDPNAFFIHRWANQLHINTKDYVVRDKLTFSENDTVDLKDLNESQRLLRAEPYIRDAKIYIADKDPQSDTDPNVESVVIETWDNWSLLPTGSFSSSGGDTRYSFGVKEDNLLGTGIRTRMNYQSNESRSGYKFAFEAPLALSNTASSPQSFMIIVTAKLNICTSVNLFIRSRRIACTP